MKNKQNGYIGTSYPIVNRFIAVWRVITKRNFILIDFVEFKEDNKIGSIVRPLYRSDFNGEKELKVLNHVIAMKENSLKKIN